MRNFIFSIILLWSLTAFSQVAIAQEKVLTLSEAEALLEKAQQKYSKAKDAYRKSLKTGEETTTLKALRSASREVGRYRLEIFKVHKRDFLRERAELSDEEAAEFFPYYEELQNKLFRIHDDAQREIKRLLRSKEPVSDAEYQAAVAKNRSRAGRSSGTERILRTVSENIAGQKIVLIFDAEARFSQEMMRTKPGKQGNRQNLLQSLKNDKK